MKRLIRDCKHKKIDRVLVKSVTRFARNSLECIETIRTMKSCGVSVLFENDHIDTETMNSEMMLYIKSAFAQCEATSASKRMSTSVRMKMEDGTYYNISRPYGYKWEDRNLVIVPEEAEIVREIFSMYLSGNSYNTIIKTNAKQWKFEEKCIKDFDFTVMDNTVKFGLFNSYSINGDLAYEINTKSYIKLSFEETDDFLFLSILFRKIKELFMLIYDRQNINLFSVDLFGAPNQVRNDGSQTARPKQVMCFVERHSEKVESEVNLKKQRIRYNTISSHFIELFEMILKDEVLVYNLHASLNARSLIDLKQSIQIASSFEHYQRTFTPEISSEDSIEVYGKIRQLVFEEAKKYTGKNKKTVENIAKRIIPTQSLKDVLCKVYKGYKEWRGLASILGEWFKAKEVPQLAQTINDWRNELAHANCKFVPTRDVITAVRLLECVNYCIIFRCAGYDDMEIKTYIEDAALLR